MGSAVGVVEEDGTSVDVRGGAASPAWEHRREVTDHTAPLRDEAEQLAVEVEALRQAARHKVWEAVVQTRELHRRLCDASARLEHLQLDIRERTGEVRLPAFPTPFTDFLLAEVRRFVIGAPAAD